MAVALHWSPTIAHLILGEKEGIPPLAAARIQRWVLVLSAHQYQIQHTTGKQNYLADLHSHLPSPNENCDRATCCGDRPASSGGLPNCKSHRA